MNPGRYFMANMAANPMMMQNSYGLSRGMGALERMVQGIKAFDWGKLLNGTSKTLNVVNQTIPLIKQATPMIGNVRKMIKLAHAFGNEANRNTNNNALSRNNKKVTQNVHDVNDYPTFFV